MAVSARKTGLPLCSHQHCNERQVAAEAIKLGNDQFRPVPPAGGKRLCNSGRSLRFALDLGELVEQRPLPAVEKVDHGLALGIEAKAGPVFGPESVNRGANFVEGTRLGLHFLNPRHRNTLALQMFPAAASPPSARLSKYE